MMRLEPELTPGLVLPVRLPPGFALGDYVVDDWVRDGSIAAIYRARRATDGRCVAIKLQLPCMTRDPVVAERFEREAEVLWRVHRSPHVADLLDVGVIDDGRRYLVLEWLDGEDLEELLDHLREQDHPLPVLRACRIARDVARGLTALHEQGVVHLDLEPAHVMIRPDATGGDRVVLVDFGYAADLRNLGALAALMQADTVVGVPAYIAPERLRGGAPTPACDVFSLGVLLFETISGACLPADGWSPETLPRVDALRHGVPPALADLVRLCMSRDPAQRPASARQVTAVLDATISALEAGASQAPSSAPAEGLRTGDTLVGMVVPLAGVRIMPPARTGNTQVSLAPPFVRDEPPAQSGDTVVSLLPPPSIDELRQQQLRADDTETTMELLRDQAWPEDTAATFELEPVRPQGPPPADPDATEVGLPLEPALVYGPSPDPDATEVGMKLDSVEREPSDEDSASTLVLEPDDAEPTSDDAPHRLGVPAPVLHASSIEEPLGTDEVGSSSDSAWNAQEQPWWLRWAVAAGVMLVLGGTGTWLVERSTGDEARTAVTPTAMAAGSMSAAEPPATPAAPAGREAEPGPTSERAREGTLAASQPRLPSQELPGAGPETTEPGAAAVVEPPVDEVDEPSVAAVDEPPVDEIDEPGVAGSQPSPEAPAADSAAPPRRARALTVSDTACVEARARADAGKQAREWIAVLKATRKRGCWSSAELRVARARLRVTAFAELGELERCVAEGSKSRDREVAARTALCRKKLGGGVDAGGAELPTVAADATPSGADVAVDG